MASSNNIVRGNNNITLGSDNHVVGSNNSITGSSVFSQNINGVTVYSGSNINLFNVKDTIVMGTDITAIGVSGITLTANSTTYVQNLTVLSSITINNTTYSGDPFVMYWSGYSGFNSVFQIGNTVSGIDSFAACTGNTLQADSTIAIGANNFIGSFSNNSLSLGNNNYIGSKAGTTIGTGNTIVGAENCFAIGFDNDISASNTVAIGQSISATTVNSLYTDKGLHMKTGSTDASVGSIFLSAGVAVVNTTRVTNNSLIFLTAQDSGTNGILTIASRNIGTDFTINSSNGGDTGKIAWMLIEPF